MASIVADLVDETSALRSLVAPLDDSGWALVTPSQPWTVADQIAHLAFFDEQTALALTDPVGFAAAARRHGPQLGDGMAELHREGRPTDGAGILAWWDTTRSDVVRALRDLDPDEKVPWYGPPMRAMSAAAARMMETWAHGTDVAEALGERLPVTNRLFWIADLGVRTFSFSFANRGLDAPDARVRVALRGPSGTTRVWNDEHDASITGPVEEFCLVVAQRRHVDDTHLVLEGELARAWMDIAQIFAGPPGPGRSPSG